MPDTISLEESFEYSLRNFLEWLRIMTLEPVDLCNTMGNYNTAWELVADLKADGSSIITMPCSYLTADQKLEVHRFLDRLANIPEELLASATSAAANLRAMSHPSWMSYRSAASVLLRNLESAAGRNRQFFKNTYVPRFRSQETT